ncbi:palmitoyltransferase akr1 [Purpureocillium lavendulum]|uniref:protein S-acyltransferase n=1 Tax=Purpureocillium lavendulum TaxID=1247861 RepID=A0AB34FXI4_9HYPO|nr:palmitoyltransferase akr1 [Purpureocillium lavendulum]
MRHVVEVGGGGGEGVVLAEGGGVDHKDDGLELAAAAAAAGAVGGAGELAGGDVAQLAVAGGVDEEELCVGARGVVVVAERGARGRVGRGVELDSLGRLRGARRGGRGGAGGGVGVGAGAGAGVAAGGGAAAFEEGREGRLAGVGGAEQQHDGRGRVRGRRGEDDVQQDGGAEDEEEAEEDDGEGGRHEGLDDRGEGGGHGVCVRVWLAGRPAGGGRRRARGWKAGEKVVSDAEGERERERERRHTTARVVLELVVVEEQDARGVPHHSMGSNCATADLSRAQVATWAHAHFNRQAPEGGRSLRPLAKNPELLGGSVLRTGDTAALPAPNPSLEFPTRNPLHSLHLPRSAARSPHLSSGPLHTASGKERARWLSLRRPGQPAGSSRVARESVSQSVVVLLLPLQLAGQGGRDDQQTSSSSAPGPAPRRQGLARDSEAGSSHVGGVARVGDIAAMEKLFESGDYDATYADDEGITPLHWASINNQYAMCKFLIEHGAEINRKGGESVATPLQWAAQRCHYYTVNLLLQHGADPLITDAQGYNTLHISTFNGNVLLIVLLLHQGIPVDVLDSFGHTSLMWAAYKGFPQCVDVFLRWGASVHAADEQGFTALHWALVKGNPGCILKLIEYGADRFAKTESGKTPAVTASELNTQPAWHRALRECGYDEDGHVVTPPWPGASYFLKDKRAFATRFLFLWPFLLTWGVLFVLSRFPVVLAIPLALLTIYAVIASAKQVLDYAPSDMRHFHKTPWMAGIFAGSLFFVGLDWLFVILPATTRAGGPDASSHYILNLVFAALYCLTTFFYVASMRYDPGFVPKLNGIAEQRAVIDDLLKEWKFDEANFCVTVASPSMTNFGNVAADASETCALFGPGLCKMLNADSYTLILAVWISLQLIWVTMLVFTQFFQVSRAMTTYENMTGIHISPAVTALTSTGAPLDPNLASLAAPGDAPNAANRHRGGVLKQWSRLLGVDPFIETITGRGAAAGKNKRKKKNPYSRGCLSNCKDFWCDPAPVFGQRENGTALLGGGKVDYTAMYESPTLMRLTGIRTRGDYEAVGTEEV